MLYRYLDWVRARRRAKFVEEVRDNAHIAWAQALVLKRPDAVTDKRGRSL